MHILVTGGAGFIGSHIVDGLIERGDRVTVVDNMSTGSVHNLNIGAQLLPMDIRDEKLATLFAENRPDAVIHQAAQISVGRSMEDPLEDARINIEGTIQLLELCRQYDVGSFLFSSSAAVYGDPVDLPIFETSPLKPYSPYGISKLAGEHYIAAYGKHYGLSWKVLRYANVYGPRQIAKGEGGVVSIFCEQVIAGQNPTIQGDGLQTRDFIYVKDVARANLAALDRGETGVYNIGTQTEISIQKLLEAMEQAAGRTISPTFSAPREGDIRFSVLNAEKAGKQLGWTPTVSLTEGLKETFHYYSELVGKEQPHAERS